MRAWQKRMESKELEVPDDFDIEKKPKRGGVDWEVWLQEKKKIDDEVASWGESDEPLLPEQPLPQDLIDRMQPPPGCGPPKPNPNK